MCSFKSGIYTRDGRLLLSPLTDSHDELLTYFGIKDEKVYECANFVRLEYTPEDNTYTRFKLRVDEYCVPGWFDDEKREHAINEFAAYIRKISIRNERRDLLLGGQWLLFDGAHIEETRCCDIYAMLGNARIEYAEHGTRVHEMFDTSCIDSASNNAMIFRMQNASHVIELEDNATVVYMRDQAHIETVSGFAFVNQMQEAAEIDNVTYRAQIGYMTHKSRVASLREHARIGSMYQQSTVDHIDETAQIIEDFRDGH